KDTLLAIEQTKKKLPDIMTILGVSNVSFGLSKESRPFLNTMFLSLAVERGLDAAIIHSGKIIPAHKIPEDLKGICNSLLLNKKDKAGDPLKDFINYFKDKKVDAGSNGRKAVKLTPGQAIKSKVLNGEKDDIQDVLDQLLKKEKAEEIINVHLIGAMKEVGVLFNSGEMQLPFVLQSAEVMKQCVNYLAPFLDKTESVIKGHLLIGTVAGDVHDIGKTW
ncbi:MAG: B12-binding domain-containing protein, partial [bacterium]